MGGGRLGVVAGGEEVRLWLERHDRAVGANADEATGEGERLDALDAPAVARAAYGLVGSVRGARWSAVVAKVAGRDVTVEEVVLDGERFDGRGEGDGWRPVEGDRRGGGERVAGVGVGCPRAAYSVALVGVAVVELGTRSAFGLGERVRRGLEADVARGEPHELVGRVVVVGRSELVELDGWPLVRVEAVAEDIVSGCSTKTISADTLKMQYSTWRQPQKARLSSILFTMQSRSPRSCWKQGGKKRARCQTAR